jgi:hypothetical protein
MNLPPKIDLPDLVHGPDDAVSRRWTQATSRSTDRRMIT